MNACTNLILIELDNTQKDKNTGCFTCCSITWLSAYSTELQNENRHLLDHALCKQQ